MTVYVSRLRGKPHWVVDVRRHGRRRRRYLDRARHLRREATEVERQLQSSLDEEHAVSSGGVELSPTFAAFAARYLALEDSRRSSYANKRRNLEQHLVPFFGSMSLEAIELIHVDEFKATLRRGSTVDERSSTTTGVRKRVSARRRDGPRSPKTINNILGTLRSVLGRAREYGILDRVPQIRNEREAKRDPEFLDPDEASRLLAALRDPWRMLALFAIRTGLRRGELMALRWSDLSLSGAGRRVRVQRAMRRLPCGRWDTKDPKSFRPRSVPLSPEVVRSLRALPRASANALVFPGGDGGCFDEHAFYRAIGAAARTAGIEKHVHTHMLRHTFASHSVMFGVPIRVVQRWLGHASVSTTERYAHLRPDFGDELVKRLDQGGPVC